MNSAHLLKNFFFWAIVGFIIGTPIGLISALFLYSLNFVTEFRESHSWIFLFLPLAGLAIGILYNKSEQRFALGNAIIFQEYFIPQKTIPILMAPVILISTLLSHLVGASVGREGTAIQMGAVIADKLHFFGSKFNQNRSLFLLVGVGAGFASLFGTPWAGACFAVEILRNKSVPWSGLFPALTTSFSAYYVCLWTGAPHTHYDLISAPEFTWTLFPYLTFSAALFGFVAFCYIRCHSWFEKKAQSLVKNPVWRPFVGGILLLLIFVILGNSRYMGLGLETIQSSFYQPAQTYDFAVKLVLTALALGFGFKGGEVTPLFFVGATLGSILSLFLPLPISFLAAIGFISVFSGATKTFFASAIMGIELFGLESAFYFLGATVIAQLFSGKRGIYKNQPTNHLDITTFIRKIEFFSKSKTDKFEIITADVHKK